MDIKIRAEVEKLLQDASIASVKSWLKAKRKKSSAGTRENIIDRVTKLIEKGDVTFAEVEDAIIGIEEAGAKYILLFNYKENRTTQEVEANLKKLEIKTGNERVKAKLNPAKPSLEYAILDKNILRIKWSETHKHPTMDFEADKIVYSPVTKIVVLIANLKSKEVQIRFDKAEKFTPHSSVAGAKNAYYDHYQQKAEAILGVKLIPTALQNALRHLIDDVPSLIRLHRDAHKNKRNSTFNSTAGSGADIRQDEDFQAMLAKSGKTWAFEGHSFYWRPGVSKGILTREVYSNVDALTSSLRVDADCWDAEVDYAVQKIRELQ